MRWELDPYRKHMSSEARTGYVSIQEADKKNEAFENYYRAQNMMDEGEFGTFIEILKKPLPTTFRITGHGNNAALVKEQLLKEHIPKLEEACKNSEAAISVPKVISWYPNELAWQLETDRAMVRKEPSFASFYRWLVDASENGDVTRQEAVSMIPPMLLDVESNHMVLDMCAAPGSKTSQLLEQLHVKCSLGEIPNGAIIANDLNKDRAYMLFHQVKRFDSPALLVCNHDGSFFPNLYLSPESKEPVEFDRILADVPCSGDGTLRKNIDVWKTWSPRASLGLHPIQIRILERALSMLKVGGRMVYSTCSFNPVENEAVIAHILKTYPSSVRIVDAADKLSGLKYRPGLKQWKILDKAGKEHIHPSLLGNDSPAVSNYSVPLSAFWIPEYDSLPLEKCIRVLPHDQNSGGFFIVLLEKIAEIGNEKSRGARRKMVDGKDEGEVAVKAEAEKVVPQKRGRKGFRVQDEEPFGYVSKDSPIISNIIDFFGLDTEKMKHCYFLNRSSKELPKSLYFVSNPIADLVRGGNDGFRIVNTGVKCFELYDNKNNGYTCPYRQTMDALASMLPLMTKRIYQATAADLLSLLASEDSIANESLSESLQAQINGIDCGSAVLCLNKSKDCAEIAVPVWTTGRVTKAFVARPDRPKLVSHLQELQ